MIWPQAKKESKSPLFASFKEGVVALIILDGMILIALAFKNPDAITLRSMGILFAFGFVIPMLAIYFFNSRHKNLFKNVAEHPFSVSAAIFAQLGIFAYSHPDSVLHLSERHMLLHILLLCFWVFFPFLPQRYRSGSLHDGIYSLPLIVMCFSFGFFTVISAFIAVEYVLRLFGIQLL